MVLAAQPFVALAAARVPGIDQFPGVLLIAGALVGAYWAGAVVGVASILEALVVWLVVRPRAPDQVTTGGILAGVLVAGLAGVAVARALGRERRSRDASREGQERYRRLLDMTFDAIVLSQDAKVVDANSGFERLTGISREAAVGRELLSFVAPESLAAAQEQIATRSAGPVEISAFGARGEQRTVRIVSQDVTHRGRPARLSAIKDVTAERRLDEERRAVEQRFRALFDSAAVAVTLATIDGVYLEANDVYCALVGRTRDEVVGRHFSEFTVAAEGGEYVLPAILAGEPGPFRFEGALRNADGDSVPVRVTISLVRDDTGDPLYTVAILESIAAQRRLEEQIRQKQKMEAIGQLAGGVAHDFNNLLTVIGGNVLLLGLTQLPEDARGYVSEISTAADRAGALTRQLLTFSRAQEPELREIALNELVSGLEPMLTRLIGADVEVEPQLEPELPLVLADPVQLELVLLNLAANARDAMPGGGRLTIRTESAGDEVALSVADTGTGMDDATRQRVFEPFFTTKKAGEGTGLGLANVYGIVLRAGGEIEVQSELGAGTTFRVTLPSLPPEAVLARLDDEDDEALPGRSGCVLFVDDEPSVRRIAGVALARAGHEPVLAASGLEALELLARGQEVDLLVTDVVMPGMNGIELAERVRSEHPEIGILFVSGYADRVLSSHDGDGPVEVLDKPFTPAALADRVARALARS